MQGIGKLVTVALFLSLSVVPMVGCQEQLEPPYESIQKGNPKLDSQLNQLIQAEQRGDAASVAEQSNIELVDGNVRVIVECLPDQANAAFEAAIDLGTVETSYNNLLQVLVPITNLSVLADETSVRFIRLPQYPVPGAEGGSHVAPNQ
jgi:hypothetical protein